MTHEALVRELLGKAADGVPDPAAEYRLGDVSDAEIRDVRWLWEGYVLKGQITLLDARGSSGKTRLFLAMAAAGSLGILPFGAADQPVKTKPFRTILFSTEDDRGDLRKVFEDIGGDLRYLEVWDTTRYGHFALDADGMARMARFIEVNEFEMVGFDPVLQYMPREVKSQNDNVAVTQFLASQREVAMATGASLVNIRHWARGQVGKEVHEMGAGGESWRNGSRGQIVMFPHPDNGKEFFQALAVPARATIRTTLGRPFGIEIRQGRQTFVAPGAIDLEAYAARYEAIRKTFNIEVAPEPTRGSRGPHASEKKAAKDAITEYLAVGPKHYQEIRDTLEERGIARRTFYRARDELLKAGHLRDIQGVWSLGDDYDPFAD
jgi:hypothetical protein